MAGCMAYLGNTWHQDALWEEDKLAEAVSCFGQCSNVLGNLGSYHPCGCYFDTYHYLSIVTDHNNLYVKLEKCKFHRHNMTFLGYVLSRMVVEMDQSKILPVTKWPVPATLKELQRFLGLANF
ncbi:hypothetical protein QTP86_024194 [Hemibagrus guttatus]|nr:hypothetical protein QTP86_024194 [Hemibagrus guttatus]